MKDAFGKGLAWLVFQTVYLMGASVGAITAVYHALTAAMKVKTSEADQEGVTPRKPQGHGEASALMQAVQDTTDVPLPSVSAKSDAGASEATPSSDGGAAVMNGTSSDADVPSKPTGSFNNYLPGGAPKLDKKKKSKVAKAVAA